jgi:hypothetical protein
MAIQLSGSLAITGSLVATSQIIAQTLNVQQVTSSIVYSSGSNIFGNSVSNTQQFTGSLQVSGSNHYVLGNVGIGTLSPITNLHIVNNTNVGLRLQATAANGSSELDLLSHGTQNAFLDYGPNALRFRSTNSDMSAIVSGSVLVLENGGSIGVGTTSPDIFSRGDALNVGISAAGASDNMALSLNAGGSGGRGAQLYMGQGGTRHFTLSSNATETTLGTSTNTPLRLNTNDTTRMFISSSGNVGIGTVSPGYKLDVQGNAGGITINTNGSLYAGGQFISGTGEFASNSSETDINFRAGGTHLMVLKASGNVGIGTTSPAAELQVGKSSDVTIALSNSTSVTSGTRGGIAWYNSSVSTVANIRAVAVTDNVGTELQFYTRPAAGSLTQAMTLSSNGRLGIGATSMTYALQVNDTAGGNMFRFTSGTAVLDYYVSSGNPSLGMASNNNLAFRTNDTERLRITSDGNLLVGTTSLRVTGYTTGNSQYAMENTGYGGAQWFTNRNDEEGSYIVLGKSRGTTVNSNTVVASGDILGAIIFQGTDGTNSDPAAMIRSRVDGTPGTNDMPGRLEFLTTADGSATLTERMRITNAGRIGIGTATPRTRTEFSSGLPTSIPTHTNTTNGIAVTDGGAIYGRIGVADLSAGGVGYPTYIQAGDWDGATYYNILLNPLGGRVSVGTTSPGYLFQVNGPSGDWAGYFKGSSTSNNSFGLFIDAGTSSSDSPFMVRSADGATTFLRILGNGNVGIGTTSPSSLLTLRPPTNGTSSTLEFSNSDNAVISAYYSLTFAVNNSNTQSGRTINFTSGGKGYSDQAKTMMVIQADSGNVGIGTTSPSSKLHVFDSTTAATTLVRGIDANLASSYMLQHGGGGSRTEVDGTWYMSYGSAQTDFGLTPNLGGGLVFWFTSGSTTTNPMTLKRSGNAVFTGNVGIGTASPSHILDVNGGAADTTLRVQTTGQNPVRLRLTNEERDFILTNNPGDDLLSFFYADANRLQFNTTNQWFPNGNVGIGTTSPSTKLHVAGIITAATTSNSGRINFGLEDTGIAIYRDNAYDLVIQQDASSGSPVYISGAGNVVISIDSNNNQTDCAFIVGSNAIKSVNTLFSVNESGNATVAGTLTELSSIRYKENIENIRYGLDKVVQLRGVTYTKKDTGVKEIGLIAEEVESILPDLILRNPEGEADSISYSRITALLIEAIKELKIEIEELKANR